MGVVGFGRDFTEPRYQKQRPHATSARGALHDFPGGWGTLKPRAARSRFRNGRQASARRAVARCAGEDNAAQSSHWATPSLLNHSRRADRVGGAQPKAAATVTLNPINQRSPGGGEEHHRGSGAPGRPRKGRRAQRLRGNKRKRAPPAGARSRHESSSPTSKGHCGPFGTGSRGYANPDSGLDAGVGA